MDDGSKKQKLDYSKLTPEQRKLIEQAEKNKPINRMIRQLEDLATISHEVLEVLEQSKKGSDVFNKELGPMLLDMRESLDFIKGRKDPEMPDHAKPVVEAVEKLQGGITQVVDKLGTINVQPNVKVGSPNVNVEAPDFKDLEDIIKKDIPKAFKGAVKAIPATEIPESTDYTEFFEQMLEWLESIDTASRMVPQYPIYSTNANNQLEVDIIDASVTVDATDLDFRDLDASQDNVAVSDGTDTLGVNADGSINTNATQSGTWNVGTVTTVPQPTPPTTFIAFVTDIPSAGTRVNLASNACNAVIIQAPSTNTGNIYVGDNSVSSTDFAFELQPGQMAGLAIDNTNKIWVDAATNGDDVSVGGS